jgi:hypothetical protein
MGLLTDPGSTMYGLLVLRGRLVHNRHSRLRDSAPRPLRAARPFAAARWEEGLVGTDRRR